MKTISTSRALGENPINCILAAEAPWKRFGRRRTAVTSFRCKHFMKLNIFSYFSCNLTSIPDILQRRDNSMETQLCVTGPLQRQWSLRFHDAWLHPMSIYSISDELFYYWRFLNPCIFLFYFVFPRQLVPAPDSYFEIKITSMKSSRTKCKVFAVNRNKDILIEIWFLLYFLPFVLNHQVYYNMRWK